MLAVAESWENGKPVRETLAADLPLAVDHFRYFAGATRSLEGRTTEIDKDTVAYHFHEPLGVVGPDHPLQLPAAHGGVEDRPGARRGQLHGRQAGFADAVVDPEVRRAASRASCPPASSTSSPAPAPRSARRSPRARASPRSASPARPPPGG